MASRPGALTAEQLRRLNPRAIEDAARIGSVLERLRRDGVTLWRSLDQRSRAETARVVEMNGHDLVLETRGFARPLGSELLLRFSLDGRPYLFTAAVAAETSPTEVRLRRPAVLYEAERRDRERRDSPALRVRVRLGSRDLGIARVLDASPDGLGLELAGARPPRLGAALALRFTGGPRAGERLFGEVRSAAGLHGRPGWTRIGLTLLESPRSSHLEVQRIPDGDFRARQLPALARSRSGSRACAVREGRSVVFRNEGGERICGILDTCGDAAGAPAVIVPPAWGRTKETLRPLAATIIAMFREAALPIAVLRFDGVGKVGESDKHPGWVSPGTEYHDFTFSQGVEDIRAALGFCERELGARPAVLVTFSATAIEGRRVVLTEEPGRFAGWISVVGAADAQSLTRAVSAGIDYFGGVERGIRFGDQEVQGQLVDIDHWGRDSIRHRFPFLSDARREFAGIRIPVTWIHGRHDAWMDLGRVRDALSCGDTSQRRLVEIPTGHQLRSSEEALAAFQLIAGEIARITTGREISPVLPDPAALASPGVHGAAKVDVRGFWRDYVIGRDGNLGMDLVLNTSAYQDLMEQQIRALALRDGERVIDLGSGLGPFPLALMRSGKCPPAVQILEVDCVSEALVQARRRLDDRGPDLRFVACDLSVTANDRRIPCVDAAFHKALASLLLNYVGEPETLLWEARRVLRPGGKLVLSSLKRDADISGLAVDMTAELRGGRGSTAFGEEGERGLTRSLRSFFSDAARLLDLEERGLFHFWSASELVKLLEAAGFQQVQLAPAFGRVPQAFVVSGRRA